MIKQQLIIIVCNMVIDNTNIESKTRYVVKYIISNIMSTALTVRREDGYVLAFRVWVTV